MATCNFLILGVILSFVIFCTDSVSVIKFQENGKMTADSYIRYTDQIPTISVFSFCLRVKLKQARTKSTLVSYSLDDFDNELYVGISVKKQSLDVSCCHNRFITSTSMEVSIYSWISICLSIDFENHNYVLTNNGQVLTIVDTSQDANHTGTSLEGSGSLLLGQDQDSYGGQYNPYRSISGEIADFFLFRGILDIKEMKSFSVCQAKFSAMSSIVNFLNLSTSFELHNISVVEVEQRSFCNEIKRFYQIYGERKTFVNTKLFCESLGGQLTLPVSSMENEELFNKSKDSFLCQSKTTYYNDALWLGARVSPSNKTWQHFNSNNEVNFTNFAITERKPLEKFRCVTLYACESTTPVWHAKWLMRKCSDRRKTVCIFKDVPIFKLRGLCHKSLFDRKYFISPTGKGNEFQGLFFSKIFPSTGDNKVDQVWKIKRVDMPGLKAEMNRLSELDYATGRNNWTVNNDVCQLNSVILKLTICKQGEFSCNDRSCIKLELRCNSRFDCPDESDEQDCHPLILPPKYSSQIPPPSIDNVATNNITINIEILNILEFNVESFRVVLEIDTTIKWKDPRLMYRNLKRNTAENEANDFDKVIWVPTFTVTGPYFTYCDVNERFSIFTIEKQSDPLPDDDQYLNEDYRFAGSENTLVWKKRDTTTIFCQFDLVNYPFDFQTCELNLQLQSGSEDQFRLISQGIIYKGEKRLLEYEVLNITIGEGQLPSSQRIDMRFRNLVTNYVSNTFAPTFLMLIIGYLTFYFAINDFNERIMVSVTALLVQSSFFSDVTDSIPKTVYLKKVDMWCIFCIIVLFLITVALTIINFYRDSSHQIVPSKDSYHSFIQVKSATKSLSPSKPRENRLSWTINRICQILFPVTSLTYIIWYTASSLTNYFT